MIIKCWDDVQYLLRYTFFEKTIALLQLLHYCNSFLGGQLLHIAIFNRFFDHYCYCNSSEHYCQCLDIDQYLITRYALIFLKILGLFEQKLVRRRLFQRVSTIATFEFQFSISNVADVLVLAQGFEIWKALGKKHLHPVLCMEPRNKYLCRLQTEIQSTYYVAR